MTRVASASLKSSNEPKTSAWAGSACGFALFPPDQPTLRPTNTAGRGSETISNYSPASHRADMIIVLNSSFAPTTGVSPD
jgi:hypothetical protein